VRDICQCYKCQMVVCYRDDYSLAFLLKQVSSETFFDICCSLTWNTDQCQRSSVAIVSQFYSIYKTFHSVVKLLMCMCKHNFS
jgi:hypothetical protein